MDFCEMTIYIYQESRDPRRIHWLLEALLDEPLTGESGSFADARYLYTRYISRFSFTCARW